VDGITFRAAFQHRLTEGMPVHTKVFTGFHCEMTISRPDAGVALIVYRGSDIGEFGHASF
jgi:hypothetical protein